MLNSTRNVLFGLISGLLGFSIFTVEGAKTSTIATFNIQNLGPSKVNKPEVMQILKQIMSRYDIIAVQEIQDRGETSAEELLQVLNEGARKANKYDYVLSDLVGDTNGEAEQYGLFYKPRKVKLLRRQHYDDVNNYYSRVPYLTEIKYSDAKLPSFVLVNIHAKPDGSKKKATVKELDHLADVYDYIKNKMKVNNVIFVGDMNADGGYVGKRDWANIRFRTEPQFQWLIPDSVDTTVGNSDMAYDRIIVAGDELRAAIIKNSAKVYRFDEEMEKAGEEMDKSKALKVSDHYPVEVKLRVS